MYPNAHRLDDRHHRGGALPPPGADIKLPPESDTDSIADYADGENTGNFVGMTLLVGFSAPSVDPS